MWDLNAPLTLTFQPNTYDLIHSRFVAPGIERTRWLDYVKDLRRLLRRNGWVQMVEYYYNFQSDSGLLTDNHAIRRWYAYYRHAMETERDPRVGSRLQDLMRNAGLVDIQGLQYSLPIGPWSTGMAIFVSLLPFRIIFSYPLPLIFLCHFGNIPIPLESLGLGILFFFEQRRLLSRKVKR